MATEIVFKEESYKIMGACFEVYKEKGCGFLEPVYQTKKGQGQSRRRLFSERSGHHGGVLLDEHRAQVHNYLKATGHRLGLLVAHYPQVEYERIVR